MKTILLLLLITTPAEATDWKPYIVLALGQSLDTVTTLHPTSSCVETNPRYGPLPSAWVVLPSKAAIIGGIALLVRFAETRESRAARIIAKSAAYLGGAIGAKDGVSNLRTCGW